MERFQVTIANDGLDAKLRVSPGPAATLADLRSALAAAGIVHGIDEPALRRLADRLDDPATQLAIEIAHGSPPVAGEDGRLDGELLGPRLSGTTDERGEIDFRERATLRPAAAGEVVAEIVEPTPGTAGRDVRGRELLSRPGRPHGQRLGPGVERAGDSVMAVRDGVLLATDQLVDVVPLYTHRGDVDYASGNLHTRGSLVIEGDVREGFTATADGDVAISGAIQGGGVQAGGSVHVGLGILGHEHAVEAGADIECRHATAARLVARASIKVGDQVNQCRLQAPRIRVAEGRGAVRGSELHARHSIEVKNAGSETGVETVLSVGELLDERVDLARQTVATSRLMRDKNHVASRGSKGLRAAVRAGDQERSERLRLLERQRELLQTAAIRITDTCHPGVVLKFGTTELRPNETLGPSAFHFDFHQRTIVRDELQ